MTPDEPLPPLAYGDMAQQGVSPNPAEPLPPRTLTGHLAAVMAENAALLATRDRYEKALREIVTALEDRSPSALARKAAVNVAREALAAAQEGGPE